jgi:hypothetical protein
VPQALLDLPGTWYHEPETTDKDASALLLPQNEITPNSEHLSYALCFFIKGQNIL